MNDTGDRSANWHGVKSDSPGWRRWLRWWAVVFGATLIGVYICILLVDPFATGRFALTQRIDITSRNTRLAKAGLVRDQQFDAAIFGNSTSFGVDPAVIGAGIGHRVVALGMSLAMPADQVMMARLFEKLHPRVATVNIFTLDEFWCRPGSPAENPVIEFPSWLYVGSNWEYLSHIFFVGALQATLTRIGIWLDLWPEDERSDGYGSQAKADPAGADAAFHGERPVAGVPASAPFPAIDTLAALLDELPSDATAVVVFLPVFINSLPLEGSPAAARLDACKARMREVVGSRPKERAYVDLRIDNPLVRDTDNFIDPIHFRGRVGGWVAAETVRALSIKNSR